jgi:hypothetical protein
MCSCYVALARRFRRGKETFPNGPPLSAILADDIFTEAVARETGFPAQLHSLGMALGRSFFGWGLISKLPMTHLAASVSDVAAHAK